MIATSALHVFHAIVILLTATAIFALPLTITTVNHLRGGSGRRLPLSGVGGESPYVPIGKHMCVYTASAYTINISQPVVKL